MEAESLLKDFGLTEYEIKAYVSLLKLGIATADQISNLGNIPLPRVYDTLVELQKKGFVLINKGRPKKFKPITPPKALKSLIEIKKKDFEKQIEVLKNDVNKIVKELDAIQKFQSKKEEKYDIWSTKMRENVQKILEDEEKTAKNEILIFSGDMSWLPERVNNIKKCLNKGVKIRILIDKPDNSKDIKKHLKVIKKFGASIRLGYKSNLRGEIVDDKIALIAAKKPMTESGGLKSDYELTMFNNPVMINAFKENFDFWWNKLK